MTYPDSTTDTGQEKDAAMLQGTDADSVRALQRCIAEASLRRGVLSEPAGNESLSEAEIRGLVHELRVHQVELEMQNESLMESQAALDAVRARYFDLYDMAPIAYCTVSEQGLIWQANLAASRLFGVTRNALLNQPFFRHVFFEDQDIYYLVRRRLAAGGKAQHFELRLTNQDDQPFWASLTVANGLDACGMAEMRMVLTDISGRRKTSAELEHARSVLQDANIALDMTCGASTNAAREQSDMAGNIRRELDARLQAMLAEISTARSLVPTPEQQQDIERIERAVKNLLCFIDEQLT